MIGEHLDWKFEYDDHNRVIMSMDPAGLPTRYEYGSAPDGSLNRITAIPPEGVPVGWNLSGARVVEMHDSQGSVHYQYDESGNLIAVERANSPAIRYSYDADRHMTEMRVGDSYRLAWSYDFLGRITAFQSPAGLVQYDYQSGMSEVRRALPNGITTFWKTAPHGRLANITHGFFPNPKMNSYSVLAAYDYSHGPDGRIAAVRERSPQGECAKHFAYDTMGRLARAQGSDRREYIYRYDELGNRTQATLPGGKAQLCEFDWAGQLVSVDGVPVTYDLCGNVIGLTLCGVQRTYRYRPDGRLAEVTTGGDTVRYAYDGHGRLVARLQQFLRASLARKYRKPLASARAVRPV